MPAGGPEARARVSGCGRYLGSMIIRFSFGLLLAGAMAAPVAGQSTRAERTGSRETSTLADVRLFLDSLAARTPFVRIASFGRTALGHQTPYVVASRPLVTDPADAHRSGRPIVYIQANIHGGEVEGKEASLMLLRDLTVGSLQPLLDSLVLVVVPVYNADGNEAFGPGDQNRRGQQGPAVVGRRQNGQGLDLNRDLVKQEAPETRHLLALVDRWDPDLYLDLHTTNGSYHGYVLTYSAGNNANPSLANDYVRDRLLPEIRTRMRTRHGHETYWYGNFLSQHPDSLVRGWQTFDPGARYATNWFGLRGRMSILSEAYSNADFPTRIRATYDFVLEILRYTAAERTTIKAINAATAIARPDSVVVSSRWADPVNEAVIAEITHAAGEGAGPFARRLRTGTFRTVRMPAYVRFAAAAKEPVRAGYILPPQHEHLVALLRRQGILVERLLAPWSGPAEVFRVDSLSVAGGVFEGHRLIGVHGAWRPGHAEAAQGSYLVPTDQRLGLFAAYLLEPASEDGFAVWNLLDRDLRRGADLPIVRVAVLPGHREGLP